MKGKVNLSAHITHRSEHRIAAIIEINFIYYIMKIFPSQRAKYFRHTLSFAIKDWTLTSLPPSSFQYFCGRNLKLITLK